MTSYSAHNPPSTEPPPSRSEWTHLPQGTAYIAIASLLKKTNSPTIILTSTSKEAYDWFHALTFYKIQLESKTEILQLPEWETLPYDAFSPQQDIISDRLHTLKKILQLEKFVLILSPQTLVQRIAPASYIKGYSLGLARGQTFNLSKWKDDLTSSSYRQVEIVRNRGEYAVRGSLIDIFPMGADYPVRADLLDNRVDSLRIFDPETQRTKEHTNSVTFLPAKEFPFDQKAISKFQQSWHNTFDGDVKKSSIYRDISDGISANGIEYYLSFFFDHLETIFHYVPEGSLFIGLEGHREGVQSFLQNTTDRYESLRHDITKPIVPPKSLLLDEEELDLAIKSHSLITITQTQKSGKSSSFDCQTLPDISINSSLENPGSALKRFVSDLNVPYLFVASSPGRREILSDFLKHSEIGFTDLDSSKTNNKSQFKTGIHIGTLNQSAWTDQICVITENQIFDTPSRSRKVNRSQFDPETIVRNLTELRIGDPVVHIEHGVGRYKGLASLEIDGNTNDFLAIQYEDEAMLYVPVTSLHLVNRYSGKDPENAPLSKLGAEGWKKTKTKATKKIHDVAAELLNIQAQRDNALGQAFRIDEHDYWRFAKRFPFEITDDQQATIDSVINDLRSKTTMDRLVCGDVGFGKTEVAMRASFIVANSGAQVLILVPTTLLAQQHFDTFQNRFSEWPIKIEMLSRLRTEKEIEGALKQIEQGTVDIVIGTHKLLSNSLKVPNLGLVIVDEEHRFGVRQKEKLKALKADVDFLALTATPIPRTLNMAINSMRDLSIIATPPNKRVPIMTFLYERRDHIVKEAITREIQRGGQVFYLHNEVRTIDQIPTYLTGIIPEARIGIAHGQMPKRGIERVMNSFYHREINILVCTTIIENGIDVPNANTIIIERADKFGLGQLHQLRGRVGRSNRQAYAYLLIPDRKAISNNARKRLEAIESAGELGMGFTLATHDLEIRGAGELLGEDQSGQIDAIGFSLYMELLQRAMASLTDNKNENFSQSLEPSTEEVNLHTSTIIPSIYLPDVHERLILYKRIAGAARATDLQELKAELIDRFGSLPTETNALLAVTELKVIGQKIGISKIDIGPKGGKITFTGNTSVDLDKIISLISQQPNIFRLDKPSGLKVQKAVGSFGERLELARYIIKEISGIEHILG